MDPIPRVTCRPATRTLSAGTPTPPAPSALLPRPRRGGGVRARAYIRGAAVPGFFPGSPHALDRGDIATGGGADGEGELVPPPLSLTLQTPCSLPALSRPAFSRQATHTLLPASPTPPAPSALLPHPRRGGVGSAWRYQGSSRIRGVAGGKPYPALFRDLPMLWTVGISPRGVGPTGRGNLFPLPCL